MSDDFYSSMYGAASRAPQTQAEQTKVVVPAGPKPAYQRLSGLKITGSHMHEIEIDGKLATIPSAAYIKLLEDQIKEMRALVRQQADNIRKANNAITRQQNNLQKLQTQIDNLDQKFIPIARGR